MSNRCVVGFTLAWLAALALCVALDEPLATMMGCLRLTPLQKELLEFIKLGGHFGFVLLIAAALALWHPLRWRAAALLCLCGMLSGLFYVILQWAVGRIRPHKRVPALALRPFHDGIYGLFHRIDNLSFPSGHAILAFAAASCLARLLPRFRWIFYAAATLVGLSRLLSDSHYLTDVLAGAGLGILATHAVWSILRAHRAPAMPPAVMLGHAQ
ncbi:MAG TPA: phosphatase PAP2 family protein [Tepidisphaeraceae bacterium]